MGEKALQHISEMLDTVSSFLNQSGCKLQADDMFLEIYKEQEVHIDIVSESGTERPLSAYQDELHNTEPVYQKVSELYQKALEAVAEEDEQNAESATVTVSLNLFSGEMNANFDYGLRGEVNRRQLRPGSQQFVCPCCNKKVGMPNRPDEDKFPHSFIDLVNDTEYFYNILISCPKCGYVFLDTKDIEVAETARDTVAQKQYQEVVHDLSIEEAFKKWVLYQMIVVNQKRYERIGLSSLKIVDFLEARGQPANHLLLSTAATNFAQATGDTVSLDMACLIVDCFRRASEFEKAVQLLNNLEKEDSKVADYPLFIQEKRWIKQQNVKKQFLNFSDMEG